MDFSRDRGYVRNAEWTRRQRINEHARLAKDAMQVSRVFPDTHTFNHQAQPSPSFSPNPNPSDYRHSPSPVPDSYDGWMRSASRPRSASPSRGAVGGPSDTFERLYGRGTRWSPPVFPANKSSPDTFERLYGKGTEWSPPVFPAYEHHHLQM
jgi:hypothetical protein